MSPKLERLPRYAELTPEREKLIDQLLDKIKAEYHPFPVSLQQIMEMSPSDAPTRHNYWRVFGYAFLVSREWKVEKAFEMAKVSIKNCVDNHLHTMSHFPTPFPIRGWDQEMLAKVCCTGESREKGRLDRLAAGVAAHFSCGFHYWDKEGLPVLYLMIGAVDEPGLLEKLKEMANVGQNAADVMWEYMQHSLCVAEKLTVYQQRLYERGALEADGVDASEGIIRSVTLLVDVGGLNYKMLWKPALDLFQDALSRMFTNYPDCVHRIIVVNCPSMVMFAYSIVKRVLPAAVQRKISFFSSADTPAAMQLVINKKYIPSFLGGDCNCDGHCIGNYNPSDPKNRDNPGGAVGDKENSMVTTENIDLAPGKTHTRTFDMKKNDEVIWEFVTTNGKDITFSIYFVPVLEMRSPFSHAYHDENSFRLTSEFLVTKNTPSEGSSRYVAKEDGQLVLMWDNKKAWFFSKNLQMKVFKQTGEGQNPCGSDKSTEN